MHTFEYPLITDGDRLPYLISGVGMTSSQPPISRDEGFGVHQLMYVREGSGVLETEGRSLILRKGDAVWLKAYQPHSYHENEPEWAINWITLTGTHLDDDLRRLGLERSEIIHFDTLAVLDDIHRRITLTLRSKERFCVYSCMPLLSSLITELYKQRERNIGALPPSDVRNSISSVTDYIDEHFREQLTLDRLSAIMDITPEHFCAIFKARMHMRPFEYVALRRIQEAKQLLMCTDLPVAQVGEQVGYGDKSYFGYVFRKHENMSPSAFRGKKL